MRRALSLALLLLAGANPLTDYIYRRDRNSTHAEVTTSGLRALDAVTDLDDPPYFWARYDGREYVIRDAATLRRIATLLDSPRDERQAVRDIEYEIRETERRLREVEREVRAAERNRDESRLGTLEKDRKRIEDERAALERKRDQAEVAVKQAEAKRKREMAALVGEAIRSGTARRHED